MENTQQARPRKPYITARLKALCAQMADHPMVVLSAPMGCGKTVAAGYLARHFRGQAFRMNVSVNHGQLFWEEFCQLLAPGVSPDSPLTVLASAICRKGPVLVLIDDYQKIQQPWMDKRLLDLALALPERLRLLVCSRNRLWTADSEPVCSGQVLLIESDDLKLEEKDILPFSRSCQVRLTTGQARMLYQATEGWFMALFMMLADYVKTGKLRVNSALPKMLVNQAYQLKSPLPRFLLTLAPAGNRFTEEQALFLWQDENASQLLKKLLDIGFYLEEKDGVYHLYPLLTASLCSRLPHHESRDLIYLRHGQWHQQQGDTAQALECYRQANQSEALLRLMDELTNLSSPHLNSEQAEGWFAACSSGQLIRHPKALLHFVWLFSRHGLTDKAAEARHLYVQARANVTDPALIQQLDLTCTLLEGCLSCRPQQLLTQLQQVDSTLRSGGSIVPLDFGGALYGSPSLLAVWGQDEDIAISADRIGQAETECFSAGTLPMKGLGDVAYSEVMYYTGNLQEADIYAHRAIRQAENLRLPHLTLAATALQARLLFAEGKIEKLQSLLGAARSELAVTQSEASYYLAGLDILEGMLWATSQHSGQPAHWLRDGRFDQTWLCAPVVPLARVCHALILCRMERYTQVLSLQQELLDQTQPLLLRIYGLLAVAVGAEKLGRDYQADKFLDMAIDLARPSALTMPFVELYPQLESAMKRRRPDWEPLMNLIPSLGEQFAATVELPAMLSSHNDAGLTAREVEIATMAANGLYNREISEKLDISENTIKSTLKNIFAKLDIHSRRELPDALAALGRQTQAGEV